MSVVIPSYRRPDLVRRCLDSVKSALDSLGEEAETVVVDDCSGDGAAAALAADHPWAVFLVLARNRGFAGAVDAGLAQARGEWILTLNNDVTLEPDAIRELLRVGRAASDIGIVGALMLFAEDGRDPTINSAGLDIDRLGVPHDRLLGLPAATAGSRPVDVFGACGGAALYRRGMLDSIGGIDATFEAYYEDADVAWRAQMAGWRALLAPGAVVHHEHSATAVHASAYKYRLVGRNRIRLLAKNATATHLLLHWPLILAYDCAYVLYAGLADRTSAPLRGRLRGLREWPAYRRQAYPRRAIPMKRSQWIAAALRRRRIWLGERG